jgi:hypothetical protein
MIHQFRGSRCWRCDAPLRNGECTFKCEEVIRLQLAALIKKWGYNDKRGSDSLSTCVAIGRANDVIALMNRRI